MAGATIDQLTTIGVAAAVSAPVGYLGYVILENAGAAVICGLLSLVTLLGMLAEPAGRRH